MWFRSSANPSEALVTSGDARLSGAGVLVAALVTGLASPFLAGCDACAGRDGEDKVSCCLDHSDDPSCKATPVENEPCGATNRSFANSCPVTSDKPVTFILDPGTPGLGEFFVVTVTNVEARSMTVRMKTAGPMSERPGIVTLEVLNVAREPVATSSGDPNRGAIERVIGVQSEKRYFIRAQQQSGAASKYELSVIPSADAYEIEPNHSAERATVIAQGTLMTGSHGSFSDAPIDIDFFRTVNAESRGTLRITAIRAEELVLHGSELGVAVFDTSMRPLAQKTTVSDPRLEIEIGAEPLAAFFVRIEGAPDSANRAYDLLIESKSEFFEIEPNDTTANAQSLPVDQTISGTYSSTAGQSDDDVYLVTVPDGASQAQIDFLTFAGDGGSGTFNVAVLNSTEAELARRTYPSDDPTPLAVPLLGERSMFVRVRSDSSALGSRYNLTVRFP
jgi:hypothetical protein